MSHATISNDFRVAIPEEIRQLVPLQPGQDVLVLARGGVITLVPERPSQAHDRAPAKAPTLLEVVAAQDVKPAGSVEEICGGWPEDELDDGFEIAVRKWRDDELRFDG